MIHHTFERRAFLGGLAAAVASTQTAQGQQPDLTPLRIGTTLADSFAEAFYANDMGFFAKAGFAVDVQPFRNGSQVASGVASGALDIGITTVVTLAQAILRGVPFTYIAGGGMYNTAAPTIVLCVASDSLFRSPKELEGKTIAVSSLHDITHLGVVNYLAESNVDVSKVSIVEMGFSEVGPALQRGAIAAGIVAEPVLSADAAQLRTFAKIYDYIGKNFLVSGWFTTADWYKKNTATAKRFAAVMYQTAKWANANRAKSGVILEKYTKIDDAAIKKMNRAPYAEALSPAMLGRTLEIAAKLKFTDRLVQNSEMIA